MRRNRLGSKTKSGQSSHHISFYSKSGLATRRALSKSERGVCPMEGSTRGGEVCGLLTSHVSCVVLGPWRRELPCLQAARREQEASEGVESRAQRVRVRLGLESAAARSLHGRRSVSCAMAACDAVESREACRIGHPPPAQIRRLHLAYRRRQPPTVSLCEAATLA